ncbi:MAG: ribonuclease P protein component [Candidatus Onthomorpha sp.]
MQQKRQQKKQNSFPKSERLTSRNDIERLFSKGGRFMAYPFSVRYLFEAWDCKGEAVSVLITSPKKYQRFAVCRNRAKRLIRETLRTSKQQLQSLLEDKHLRLLFSVSLVSKHLPTYRQTQTKMTEILSTLTAKAENENH